MGKQISFQFQGTFYDVEVERQDNMLILTREGSEYQVELIEKVVQTVAPVVSTPPNTSRNTTTPAVSAPVTSGAGEEKAPITGTIKEINIAVGDRIEIDQLIFIMEAMKMDIEVYATISGSVGSILVNPGDSVLESQALATVS